MFSSKILHFEHTLSKTHTINTQKNYHQQRLDYRRWIEFLCTLKYSEVSGSNLMYGRNPLNGHIPLK